MKKKLTHVNPIDASRVTGVLGLLYSLFTTVIFLGIGLVPGNQLGVKAVGPDAIVMLFLIPLIGFLYGLIGAALFNLLVKLTGGVEFTISDVAPPEVPPWPAALPRYPFAPR